MDAQPPDTPAQSNSISALTAKLSDAQLLLTEQRTVITALGQLVTEMGQTITHYEHLLDQTVNLLQAHESEKHKPVKIQEHPMGALFFCVPQQKKQGPSAICDVCHRRNLHLTRRISLDTPRANSYWL